MTTQLSEKESEKLFNQMSNAIREQDFDKVDELATSPVTEEETPPIEDHEDETPPDTGDEVITPDDGEEVPAGDAEPDDVKDDKTKTKPAEKTAEEKLAEAMTLLQTVKNENHNLRSQAGRVPHLQRQMTQIDKKLEEIANHAASPSGRPSTKLNERITPKLAKIRDTDPELADVLAELLADATDGVATDLWDAETTSLQTQRKEVEQELKVEEINRLLEMYPNAPEVFKSPSWKHWEAQQSRQLQTMANSDYAEDVSFAFDKYASDMVRLHPELGQKPDDVAPPHNDEAARIEAERIRKKQTSVSVGSPTSAGRRQLPDSDEKLFDEISKQIRKEISGK